MTLDRSRLLALRELQALWPKRRCVLVGATALDVRLGLRWRVTNDLDLAVELTPEELRRDLGTLPDWSRTSDQRWRSSQSILVDLIPAARELVEAGELVWPGSQARMNLAGFDHALELSNKLELGEGFTFPVVPISVLVVLKIAAYLDRPHERTKDLQDLAHLFVDYIGPEDPRRYEDDVFEAELDYEQVSAFIVGREIAEFADRRDLQLIEGFLARVRDGGDPYATQAKILAIGPPSLRGDPDKLLACLVALEVGLGAAR